MQRQDFHAGKVPPGSDAFDNAGLLRDEVGNKYRLSTEDDKRMRDLHTSSPGKEIELGIARELLNSNLTRLTALQRDVMYYTLLGTGRKKIAKTLNISVSAVDKHLQSAKRKLAKYITGTKEVLMEGIHNGHNADDTTETTG